MSTCGKGVLVVVSGPSGVGKSTICAKLLERLGAVLSVSATTRPIGEGETDGVNYYFLSREEFERRLAAGEFLEHAEYLGNLYGTPEGPVTEATNAGKDVLLDIEVEGGTQVAKKYPSAVTVFILPPSREALAGRIAGRGRDKEHVIAERLANAEREIQLARDSGVYQHFVVNDDLESTVSQIADIVKAKREALAANDRQAEA